MMIWYPAVALPLRSIVWISSVPFHSSWVSESVSAVTCRPFEIGRLWRVPFNAPMVVDAGELPVGAVNKTSSGSSVSLLGTMPTAVARSGARKPATPQPGTWVSLTMRLGASRSIETTPRFGANARSVRSPVKWNVTEVANDERIGGRVSCRSVVDLDPVGGSDGEQRTIGAEPEVGGGACFDRDRLGQRIGEVDDERRPRPVGHGDAFAGTVEGQQSP